MSTNTACPFCEPERFDADLPEVPVPLYCAAHSPAPPGTMKCQKWSDAFSVVFTGKVIVMSFPTPLHAFAFDAKDAQEFLKVFTVLASQLPKQ
jgi:hypothetical protein